MKSASSHFTSLIETSTLYIHIYASHVEVGLLRESFRVILHKPNSLINTNPQSVIAHSSVLLVGYLFMLTPLAQTTDHGISGVCACFSMQFYR